MVTENNGTIVIKHKTSNNTKTRIMIADERANKTVKMKNTDGTNQSPKKRKEEAKSTIGYDKGDTLRGIISESSKRTMNPASLSTERNITSLQFANNGPEQSPMMSAASSSYSRALKYIDSDRNHQVNELDGFDKELYNGESSNRDQSVSCIDIEIDLVVRLLATLVNSRQLNERNRRKLAHYVAKHITRLTAGAAPKRINGADLGAKNTVGGQQLHRHPSSDSSVAQMYRVEDINSHCCDGIMSLSTQALPGSKVINHEESIDNDGNASRAGSSPKSGPTKNTTDSSLSNECIVQIKGLQC